MEEYDVDYPGEFGRDDKNDEIFEIQPDAQAIIVEEKPAVCNALRKLQTFYNDAPAATTTPQSLRSGRELPQADSVREEEEAISMSNILSDNVPLLSGSDMSLTWWNLRRSKNHGIIQTLFNVKNGGLLLGKNSMI